MDKSYFKFDHEEVSWSLDVSKIVAQMVALEEDALREAVIAKLRSMGYSVVKFDEADL